jgi:hypothetical protein
MRVGRNLGAIAVRAIHHLPALLAEHPARVGDVVQLLDQRPRLRLGIPLIDAQPFAAASVLRGEAADVHERRRGRTPIAIGRLMAWGGGERLARHGCRAGQSRQERAALHRFHVNRITANTRVSIPTARRASLC